MRPAFGRVGQAGLHALVFACGRARALIHVYANAAGRWRALKARALSAVKRLQSFFKRR